MRTIKRGEIWWVDFGSPTGGEIQKRRPAIIVSNDASNRHLNRVQLVPLTSRVHRVYPSEALLVVRGRKMKAMADQLTTASKHRLVDRFGSLAPQHMEAVERAIRTQLALSIPEPPSPRDKNAT
jgi:mRNA interferase MazF